MFSTTPNSKKVSTNKWVINGQPEVAVRPSKPEVLISATIWEILQFRGQSGKLSTRASEFAESVNKWLQHQWQPEIATWLPKPEIVIPLELQLIASKLQRQVRYFWLQWVGIKCPHVIVTMSDNRKWHALRPLKPEMLIFLEPWQAEWQFEWQMWGFRPRPARKNWPRAIATTTDNRKWKHRRFGPELVISGSRSLSKSFGYIFIDLVIIENLEFVVGILTVSVIVSEM